MTRLEVHCRTANLTSTETRQRMIDALNRDLTDKPMETKTESGEESKGDINIS